MYAVFKFPKGAKQIDELYHDDIVSRQSIVKRDGKSLNLDDSIFVLIEGSEAAIERANSIAGMYRLSGSEEEDIYRKIKESEDAASMGMGAIFG